MQIPVAQVINSSSPPTNVSDIQIPVAQVINSSNSPSSYPPPNVLNGGIWGTSKYVGSTTEAISFLGLFCFVLPGLLCILLCPMDRKDAYMVDGKVYDASGKYLGTPQRVRFVPSR